MGGNASANNMLTGGEGGSKKPDFVLTLYVYLPYVDTEEEFRSLD